MAEATRAGSTVPELPRGPGRPRSAEADERLIDAAVEELGAVGYARLTLERVAKRARVSRTTLYRRWQTKLDLVLDVMNALDARVEIVATGDCRTDLENVMRLAVEQLALRPDGRAFVAVVAEAVYNPALAAAFRARFMHQREAVRSILTRGIAGGELRPDLDIELVMDQLAGIIPYRMIVSGEPIPVDLPERAVSSILAGAHP